MHAQPILSIDRSARIISGGCVRACVVSCTTQRTNELAREARLSWSLSSYVAARGRRSFMRGILCVFLPVFFVGSVSFLGDAGELEAPEPHVHLGGGDGCK